MNSLLVNCQECGTKNRISAGKQHLHPRCGRCGRHLDLSGAGRPVEVSDTELQELVTTARLPLLVALLSPSCGYCRMMGPVLEHLARRYLNRFIVARLDTSLNPLTPSRFRIQGVPTLLFSRPAG